MDAQVRERPYHTIGRFGRGHVRPLTLRSRDLDYLQALFIHGALSTVILGALVAPEDSPRAISDRLFLLRNPPNEYVAQPAAQQRAINAYRSHLVLEITEKGAHALVDSGRITYEDFVLWKKLRANFKPHHFDHDRMAGHVLASFDLGARDAGIRFITWRDILNRPRCPVATREAKNPLAIPYEANGERHLLIPDGLFGLQYPNGACFFALEIDMGTEQHKESDLKNVTLRQKFRAYRTIMREKLFASQFGLPSLLLLVVTPGIVRLRNMMEDVSRICDHDGGELSQSFLFKSLPYLARQSTEKLPAGGEILTLPWSRPQHSDVYLGNL